MLTGSFWAMPLLVADKTRQTSGLLVEVTALTRPSAAAAVSLASGAKRLRPGAAAAATLLPCTATVGAALTADRGGVEGFGMCFGD